MVLLGELMDLAAMMFDLQQKLLRPQPLCLTDELHNQVQGDLYLSA